MAELTRTILAMDACDQLLGLIESAADADEQAPPLRRLVDAHQTVNFAIGRDAILWRARRCDGEPFLTESCLSYPPARRSSIQRLNDRGHPVLYLATSRETALAEIDAQTGDLIHVGAFRAKPGASLQLASVGAWYEVFKLGKMRLGTVELATQLTKVMNNVSLEAARSIIYLDAILGDLLAQPDAGATGYLTTRLLAKAIYAKHPHIEGIVYPSAKDTGVNIAVRAEPADRALEGCGSMLLDVQKRRRLGIYDYRVLRVAKGVQTDGSFEWMPTCEPHEQIIYRIRPGEAHENVFPYTKRLTKKN